MLVNPLIILSKLTYDEMINYKSCLFWCHYQQIKILSKMLAGALSINVLRLDDELSDIQLKEEKILSTSKAS